MLLCFYPGFNYTSMSLSQNFKNFKLEACFSGFLTNMILHVVRLISGYSKMCFDEVFDNKQQQINKLLKFQLIFVILFSALIFN